MILFDLTHMMSMTHLVVIVMETSMIDCQCALEKEFTKLIHTKPWMVLYLNFNHVNLLM